MLPPVIPLSLESALNVQQVIFSKNATNEGWSMGEFPSHVFKEMPFPLSQMHDFSALLRKHESTTVQEQHLHRFMHFINEQLPVVYHKWFIILSEWTRFLWVHILPLTVFITLFTKRSVSQGLALLVPRTLNTEIVASKCQVPVGIKAYCDVRKGFKNSYICSHKCFSVENLSFKLH